MADPEAAIGGWAGAMGAADGAGAGAAIGAGDPQADRDTAQIAAAAATPTFRARMGKPFG